MPPSGQPSILSFFHKQHLPKHAGAPAQTQAQARQQDAPPTTGPPRPPPIPQPSPAPQSAAPSISVLPTAIPSPHPSAAILPVTESHIPALRRINALLLPVNYTDSFYKAILDPAVSGLFSRAILWQDNADPSSPSKVVGGLICRLEPSPFDGTTAKYSSDLARKAGASAAPPRSGQGHALYIQSLVLLAPYRGLGLVTAALEGIFDAVAQVTRDRDGNGLRIEWVYAHVWTENEEGLGWYGRRGFERDAVLEKYYWKLRPDSAWVVKRRVVVEGEPAKKGANGSDRGLPAAVPASVTTAAVNLPGFATTTTTPHQPPVSGPPQGTAARPPPPASSLSFQNKRPDMEWNDLPEEMVTSKNSSRSDLLAPPSGSSSRSSSTGRKKKDRSYPTAAFGT